MDWGMRNRMAQLLNPDTGRAVFLPVDHGYFLGPIRKLEEPRKTIEPLLPYVDAIMLTRGILRSCVDPAHAKPVILRVSGGNSIAGKDLSNEDIITSVKEVIRLNATAVAFSIYVGSEYEHQTLLSLARLVDECQDYGIPVMAVTAVGKELEKRDARFLSLSCRIAAELGAHLVKTYHCEEFEKVVKGCPVPVVVAGGPKSESEMEVFAFTQDAIQQGAVGVDMGRNIWQHDFPVAMVRAIRAIVHENASVKQAYRMFQSIKQEAGQVVPG